MKHILYAATLGLTSLVTLSTTANAQAAAPEAPAKQSTHQLTLKILSQFQKVYTAAATATDKASAQKAVTTITAELKQVDTLTPLLAKATKPTDAEMAIVAEATAKMEVEMIKQIEIMSRNLKNREVRKLIGPSLDLFAAKSGNIKVTMDRLYPAQKMLPLVKAAKARIKIKNSQ